MKICVIGSSHTASLKLGWELVKHQFPDLELVFFASFGLTFRSLRVFNGKLESINPQVANRMAETSGGVKSIAPEVYDVFLLYGLQMIVPRLELGISAAVMKEVIKNRMAHSLARITLHRLRKITDKVIWIGVAPLPTTQGHMFGDETFHSYGTLIEEMATALEVKATQILGQPLETVRPDLCTMGKFGNRAAKLEANQNFSDIEVEVDENPKVDFKHMNGDFGAVWLMENMKIIRAG